MKRLFAAVLAILVLTAVHAQTSKRAATPAELEVIKASLQTKLKDADSVKFRDVEVSADGKGSLCGLLNSKNSYGAYAGYSYFTGVLFTEGHKTPIAVVIHIDSGDDNIAEHMCKMHGMI